LHKGENNKGIFPKGARQQKIKIGINPTFTAIVTGHGKPGLIYTDLKY
jgi:hypothetical protein